MDAGDYFQRILGKTGAAREQEALRAFEAGEIPDALLKKAWPTITFSGQAKDGTAHTLEVPVAPNFFAVGTDASPFFLPIWPTTAQKIADSLYSILPTKKLADEIHKKATNISMAGAIPAIEPWYHAGGVPGDIGNSGAWNVANQNRKKIGAARFDTLVDGHGKNVLIAPELTGAHVLIYGGVRGDGGWPLQGLSGERHAWYYVDYSHMIRFISRRAKLDGVDVDLANIVRDKNLYQLVADAPFDPTFPINKNNVGSGAPPIPSGGGGGGGGAGGGAGKPTEWPPKKPGTVAAPSSGSISMAAPVALAGGALVLYLLTR